MICECPLCGKKYKIPPDKSGKKIKCRNCLAVFEVRNPEENFQIPKAPLPPAPNFSKKSTTGRLSTKELPPMEDDELRGIEGGIFTSPFTYIILATILVASGVYIYINFFMAKEEEAKQDKPIVEVIPDNKSNNSEANRYYREGLGLLEKKKYEEALASFNKSLEIVPNQSTITALRARAKFGLGKPFEALADCDKAISLNPFDMEAYFIRADIHCAMNSYAAAISDCDKVIAKEPEFSGVYLVRGKANRKGGDYAAARKDLERAISQKPKDEESLVERGEISLLDGTSDPNLLRVDIGFMDRAIAINGNSAEYFSIRARLRALLKDNPAAQQDFESALKLDSDHVKSLFGLGSLFFSQMKFESALTTFTGMEKIEPDNAEMLWMLGECHRRLGDMDAALQNCDRSIAVKKNSFMAFYHRGLVRLDRREFQQAFDDFETSISQNDSFAPSFYHKGLAREALGSPDNALQDFDKAIELDSKYFQALTDRGRVKCQMGNASEALDDFNAALKIDANYTPAYRERGLAFQAKSDFANATSDFSRCIQNDPTDWHYALRGMAHCKNGQYQASADDLTKALEKNGKAAQYLYWRGLALMGLNKNREAALDFEGAILQEPANTGYSLNLVKVQMKDGEFLKALAEMRRLESIAEAPADFGILHVECLYECGDIDDCFDAITSNSKKFPKTTDAAFWRAKCLFEKEQYRESLEEWEKLLTQEAENPLWLAWKGRVCAKLRKYDDAYAAFDAALKMDAKSDSARFFRGESYYAQKKVRDAQTDFSEAINNNKNRWEYFVARGRTYRDLDNFPSALLDDKSAAQLRLSLLRQMTEKNPKNLEALYWAGRLEYASGNAEAAKTFFGKAIEIKDVYGPAYLWRGIIHYEEKKYQLSAQDLTLAVNYDRNNWECFYWRAKARTELGNKKGAEEDSAKVKELRKN